MQNTYSYLVKTAIKMLNYYLSLCMRKFLIWIILIVVVGLVIYLLFATEFTYSDGNRAGRLIKFSHKGFIFKTYEGDLNLGGINTTNGGVLVNNMWQFSVSDPAVADALSKAEGKDITVHYKEKMNSLPWRGDSRYIVDKIVEVK